MLSFKIIACHDVEVRLPQRTFAETVASIIMDPELRRLIVFWGICILPSISRILGR